MFHASWSSFRFWYDNLTLFLRQGIYFILMTLACFSHSKISSSLHKMIFKQGNDSSFQIHGQEAAVSATEKYKGSFFFHMQTVEESRSLPNLLAERCHMEFPKLSLLKHSHHGVNKNRYKWIHIYKYMSASYENIFQFFQPLSHIFLQRQYSDIRGSHPCIIEFHFLFFKRLLLLLIANEILTPLALALFLQVGFWIFLGGSSRATSGSPGSFSSCNKSEILLGLFFFNSFHKDGTLASTNWCLTCCHSLWVTCNTLKISSLGGLSKPGLGTHALPSGSIGKFGIFMYWISCSS